MVRSRGQTFRLHVLRDYLFIKLIDCLSLSSDFGLRQDNGKKKGNGGMGILVTVEGGRSKGRMETGVLGKQT